MLPAHIEIDRPSPSLAGSGFGAATRRAFLATRPAFLTASVLPVLVGSATAAASAHVFDGVLFGLALAATLLAHAATNVYNDVSDDQNGADPGNTNRIYPYTGGSRFIQTGLLSRQDMTRLAIGLCAGAIAVGVLLAIIRGPGIVYLGLGGLALGLLYSLPGAKLSARGIGELAVAIGLGVLPVVGAAWLQTGYVGIDAALLCIPVSCWVAAILVINEVPDIEADRRANKRTLVVRFGDRGARVIYGFLTLLAFVTSCIAIARHILPHWYLLAALALAGAGFHTLRGIHIGIAARAGLKRSIERTLALQAAGCILIILALCLERFGLS